MCLLRIIEEYDPPLTEEREAFKVLQPNPLHYRTPYREFRCVLDRWLEAVEESILTYGSFTYENKERYKTGFHVFPTKEDAEKWVQHHLDNHEYDLGDLKIFKVKIRNITYKGKDGTFGSELDCDNLVAKEMFIPSDQD